MNAFIYKPKGQRKPALSLVQPEPPEKLIQEIEIFRDPWLRKNRMGPRLNRLSRGGTLFKAELEQMLNAAFQAGLTSPSR